MCFTCNFSRKSQKSPAKWDPLSVATVIGVLNQNTKCSDKNWALASEVADG